MKIKLRYPSYVGMHKDKTTAVADAIETNTLYVVKRESVVFDPDQPVFGVPKEMRFNKKTGVPFPKGSTGWRVA